MCAERCICCGEIIPEGFLICPMCQDKPNVNSVWYAVMNKKTRRYIHSTGEGRFVLADETAPPLLIAADKVSEEIKKLKIDLEKFEVVPVKVLGV